MFSSCTATVKLDQTTAVPNHYSSGDIIKGTVVIRADKETSLQNIVVKLECTVNTQIKIPRRVIENRKRSINPNNSPFEYYDKQSESNFTYFFSKSIPKDSRKQFYNATTKALYLTKIVFPPPNLKSDSYTLAVGTYEYPFEFNVPHKTIINNAQSKFDLPPIIRATNESIITEYFIKTTVNRGSMFKANTRDIVNFQFHPDYSLKLPDPSQITFVRKLHSLPTSQSFVDDNQSSTSISKYTPQPVAPRRRKGLLSSIIRAIDGSSNQNLQPITPPIKPNSLPFYFEARFPYPATLITGSKISFNLYLMLPVSPSKFDKSKLQDSTIIIRNLSFQLSFSKISNTKNVTEIENSKKEFFNTGTIDYGIDLKLAKSIPYETTNSSSTNGLTPQYEILIDPKIYENSILPELTIPSFETPNAKISYTLHILGNFSNLLNLNFIEKSEIQSDINIIGKQYTNNGKGKYNQYEEASPLLPPRPTTNEKVSPVSTTSSNLITSAPAYTPPVEPQASSSSGAPPISYPSAAEEKAALELSQSDTQQGNEQTNNTQQSSHQQQNSLEEIEGDLNGLPSYNEAVTENLQNLGLNDNSNIPSGSRQH